MAEPWSDPGPAGAEIFRRCRAALGLTEAAMAAALYVSGGRTVRKWEAGDRAVPGPVWVALRFMLRAAPRAAAPPLVAIAVDVNKGLVWAKNATPGSAWNNNASGDPGSVRALLASQRRDLTAAIDELLRGMRPS